jgi:hypothetical protein
MGVLQSGGGSRADADRARRLEQLMQQKESQLDALAARLQVRKWPALPSARCAAGLFLEFFWPRLLSFKVSNCGSVFLVQQVEKEEAKRALEMQLRSAGTGTGTEVCVCRAQGFCGHM